ncbi:MAG: hypothetical protein JWM47_947 [Acidimicrobiales bacterium]|nr:hypothetical protein [Acidimicrobiales bacterium]
MTALVGPRRSPGVCAVPFGTGAVLHDAVHARVHLLNEIGSVVWEACDGATPIDELVEAFHHASGHPREQIDGDVRDHITALRSHGLVDRPAPPVPVPTPWADEPAGSLTSDPLGVFDEGVVVRSNDPWVIDHVHGSFSGLRGAASATIVLDVALGADGVLRLRGRGYDASFTDPDLLDEALASQLNRVAGGSASPLAVHAGAVRSPAGHVAMLVGPSGSGKSTLTATMVKTGWDYLSDEAVGVRPGSLVAVGYPKPLALDPLSQAAIGLPASGAPMVPAQRLRPDVAQLAGDVGQVAVVLHPRYRRGVTVTTRRLSADEALISLAEHALNLTPGGSAVLKTLAQLVQEVPSVELVHDGSDAAVAEVQRLTRG